MSPIPSIEIVAIGAGSASETLVLPLRDHLKAMLRRPIHIGRTIDLPRVERGQRLSSAALIEALAQRSTGRGDTPPGWVLGVTGHELIAPGRSCVFGEATLGGAWAVVSTARLGARFATRPDLLARLRKEALHELGHLAALGHCVRPRCVMRVAANLSEIDHKNFEFCFDCHTRFFAG